MNKQTMSTSNLYGVRAGAKCALYLNGKPSVVICIKMSATSFTYIETNQYFARVYYAVKFWILRKMGRII